MTQRAEYKRRKEAMHAALREHFGDIAKWTDPEGGFFCWVTLDDVDATALFEPALAEGVAFIPGTAFSPSGRFGNALRLCFASTPPDRIHEGISRRLRAVDQRHEGLTGVAVSTAERAVLDKIDEDQLIELTRSLVRAHGQNPPGEEATTAAALAGAAGALGSRRPRGGRAGGSQQPARTLEGGEGPGLLLLGHTDVVPVGDGWTKDPFGAAIHDGRIYGRGATDMKGGLAACLSAMAALQGTGLSGPVELAAVVDEEESGIGIRAYVSSPDASFLGCVTAEPTDLQTIVGARGASYVRIEIHGPACHAGNPGDGANAIYGAAAVVAEIESDARRTGGSSTPAARSRDVERRPDTRRRGGSTVPAECVVVADRRLLPGESPTTVLDDLRARIDALRLTERGLTVEASMPMEMPAFETPAESPLARAAVAAVTDAGGPALPPGGWTAACDGGFVARDLGVPVVVLGPGSVAKQAHRPDESVAIDELIVAARAYALTALRLLG